MHNHQAHTPTTTRPALLDSTSAAEVPEVRRAVAVLVRAGVPVAQFAQFLGSIHATSAGACVSPHASGEVAVFHVHAFDDVQTNRSAADRERRETAVREAADAYRDAFQNAAGWQVTEVEIMRAPMALFFLRPPALRCEVFVSARAGHCTAPATRVIHSTRDTTLRLLMCDAHPQTARSFTSPAWTSTTPASYETAHGPITPDGALTNGRQAPQD
jgi:hypothetical protein